MASGEFVLALPLTDDGDRTFQCTLGSRTFSFRLYFTTGIEDYWLLDIADAEGNPLAAGRRLVTGSTNFLGGFANGLGTVQATVLLKQGSVHDMDAPLVNLVVVWGDAPADNPFRNGDPMDNLLGKFQWLEG